ncbi:MAG: hypothetical protein ACT4P1_03300 [Sporichthyaceae bacterium]
MSALDYVSGVCRTLIEFDLDAFPAEATKVFEAASAAFDQVGVGLDELETPELDEVSESAPACADL